MKRCTFRRWLLAVTGATMIVVGLGASAGAAGDACPPGNLLAGRRPWAWNDVRGRLHLPTDGEVATEGAMWDAPLATILDSGAATLTWDLGAAIPLHALWVQADAQDEYSVWGSLDGRQFLPLGRVDGVDGHGLRSRRLLLPGTPVRYLRFGEATGDSFYSLAELQAFCAPPASYPPPVRVRQAPPAATRRTIYTYWNDQSSARWELVLAGLGLALLSWGKRLRREGRPEAHRKLRDRLLLTLGLLAALTFPNFGFFHFGNFFHTHEWTHYYLGSKYFPELGHDRLYECLSLADIQHGMRRRVELRKVTNLRTNVLEAAPAVLTDPQRCLASFSPARWQSFTRDVAFFRARMAPRHWDAVMLDHGYNATPVWTTLGAFLAGLSPASDRQLGLLALLDPLYLLATVVIIGWAFGWRVLAVALLVFATNFPSRFYWTGGSFLRWDWLFYLVASIACLARGRPALAGAALAYATALRVFPLFLFAGPALALGWQLWQGRRAVDWRSFRRIVTWLRDSGRPWARFFAGAALATALLVPISLAATGGPDSYRSFLHNTRKHQETPLVNQVGLRTVLSWRPDSVGRRLHDERLVDPWTHWKRARLQAYGEARWLHVVLVLGYLLLLARAAGRHPPWVTVALGVGLIALGVELTSYYYMFILGAALLVAARQAVGRWLLLLTAFTQIVAWAPLKGMSTWSDEQHTAMSAATVLVFLAIAWLFSREGSVGAPDTPRPRDFYASSTRKAEPARV